MRFSIATSREMRLKPQVTSRKWIWKSLAMLALGLLTLWLSHASAWRDLFTTESISQLKENWSPTNWLLLILFGLAGPIVFLPRWPVAVCCGLLFGIFTGMALALVISLAGAWIQFSQSRKFVSLPERVRHHRLVTALTDRPNRMFRVLLLARIVPMANGSLTTLICSCLGMKTGAFLGASAIGMVPSTLLYTSWGKLLKKPDPAFYWWTVSLMLGLIILTGWIRSWRRVKNPET